MSASIDINYFSALFSFFTHRSGFHSCFLERTYPHKEEVSGDVLLMIGRGSFAGVPDIGGAGQPSPVMARSMLVTAELYQKNHLQFLWQEGLPSAILFLRQI